MPLSLTRPLVFFDIESTGIDVSKDKIIDLSILKLYPDNKKEIHNFRINPGIPIPAGATKIHGITDADVKDSPLFSAVAKDIFEILKDSDYAGYNIKRFDVPLLVEEFLRVEIDWPSEDAKILDAYTIFVKKEQSNLAAAYKFFCDKDLENAHSAEADISATQEVLFAQLERYTDIGLDINSIEKFCSEDEKPLVDYARKLCYNEKGEIVFNFGKHKGKRIIDEREYCRWMYKGDFPLNTKKHLKKIFSEFDAIQESSKEDLKKKD